MKMNQKKRWSDAEMIIIDQMARRVIKKDFSQYWAVCLLVGRTSRNTVYQNDFAQGYVSALCDRTWESVRSKLKSRIAYLKEVHE